MADTTSPSASASTSTQASAAPSIPPIKAAQMRLSTLSYLVHGASASAFPHPPTHAAIPSEAALPRLTRIVSALSSLSTDAAGSRAISRLLEAWDEYAELLAPVPEGSAAAATATADATQVWDAHQQASWCLSQQAELHEAGQALVEIDTLVHERRVLEPDASRSLARNVESNTRKLATAKHSDTAAQQTASNHTARLLHLVQRWSHYTSTLSQAFTLLDEQVWTLERQVSALERAQPS
ncbi:hypothetical protein EX895_005734 [Sporisorium graminicola]|uniref:Uncharacterized protein n=1 Tax=Sporisorium graminicola TaxID=280036 RepID=A0A4U7KRG4_9BASI|nr:hypothetical protein EX895_005734 [Sporisorium graminicola]TKY85572.1 hypothetical protein EX895_005734 [Sporisorium graminicola]